uniref:C2H2-type domain-containing protein n=1 Tax=Anopheles atroparvus TaxID=41427 RepID=A0AAG5DRE9_ANOAO
MRHNDPSSFDGVIDPGGVLLHPFCYVCNLSVLQDGVGFCQMFAEVENMISPAKILSDVLEIEINSELSHSQIVCVNCNMLCLEYQQLIQRAETIRIEMTVAYNRTVMKLTGLTEKDLKENEVASADSEEHLDSALQNFNKELMSMEDVFQMEGLVPESIEEDPVRNSVHVETSLSKMNFVWDAASAETPRRIDTSSFLQTADSETLNDQHKAAKQELEQLETGPENTSANIQAAAPLMTSENSSQEDLICTEDKLEQYISKTNNAIVEVAGESGTLYCIYEDIIESYSDAEELPEHITNAATPVVEYDEIIVESSVQGSESELISTPETSSFANIVPDDDVKDAEAALPSSSEAVPDDGNNSLQPLFIKIENMYYCTLCSTNGQVDSYNVKTIALHLRNKHDAKILVCERCDAVFYRRLTYNEHMDQHTVEDGRDFRCDICGDEFENARTFRVHRKTHASVNKMWACDICDKKCASKTAYEAHMNTHTGLRPFKCTVCLKDFTSKYILSVHMRTHKERVRTFTCDKCGNAFYSRSNLVHHEKTHIGNRNFPCIDCGKLFLSQHNLNVHKVIHAAMKPYACRTCGKPFARKSEVADHERIHTGEKPFSCDLCDASFAQRSNLYSHKRLTHMNDKRFKCDTCGACFKRRRLLLYHTRAAHTGERPYKCELCDATFVYPEHFQKHKRIHSGTKPFACEVCNKTFNSRDNRNAHRYVHSDKKPFECVTCGSGFMRKSQLYAHMQKKGHLNETIVVNQPRISANDTLEYETEPIENEPATDELLPGAISKHEHDAETIETDEFYLQHADEQERAEHLLDQEAV